MPVKLRGSAKCLSAVLMYLMIEVCCIKGEKNSEGINYILKVKYIMTEITQVNAVGMS
jgi:hypothetical protein